MLELPKVKNRTFFAGSVLLAGLIIFARALVGNSGTAPGFYFLDVGQGDSELIVGRNGAKVLTDAGRGSRVEDALSRALKTSEKYIDLAIISHPQLDHYGGMRYVLDSYDLGAILTNGRAPDVVSPEWADMLAKIKEKGVPMIRVGKGDSIRFGEDKIKIISPDAALLRAKDQNESALVARAEVGGASVLLTGDIGKKTEAKLAAESPELDSHILKVAHHGSKYSVSASFFRSVSPILAIIEVGRNSYGHPSREVLESFGERGVPVLRTDLSGNIYALLGAGELKVLTEKGGQ